MLSDDVSLLKKTVIGFFITIMILVIVIELLICIMLDVRRYYTKLRSECLKGPPIHSKSSLHLISCVKIENLISTRWRYSHRVWQTDDAYYRNQQLS